MKVKVRRTVRYVYERGARGPHTELTLRWKCTAANPRDEEIV